MHSEALRVQHRSLLSKGNSNPQMIPKLAWWEGSLPITPVLPEPAKLAGMHRNAREFSRDAPLPNLFKKEQRLVKLHAYSVRAHMLLMEKRKYN